MRFYCITLVVAMSLSPLIAIAQNVAEAQLFNAKGLECLQKKAYQEASHYFYIAIQTDPSNKKYYNNYAVALLNMKEYQKAYQMLEQAIAIDPQYTKALANMAIVCFYMLRFADAYAYFMKALRADEMYTKERFTLDKIITGVKKVHDEHPDNKVLQDILYQLEIIKTNSQDRMLK